MLHPEENYVWQYAAAFRGI